MWTSARSRRRRGGDAAILAVVIAGSVGAPASASWRFDGSPGARLDYGSIGAVSGGDAGSFSCFCTIKVTSLDDGEAFFFGEMTGDGGGWSVGLGSADPRRFVFRVAGDSGAGMQRLSATGVTAGAWYTLGGSCAWDASGPGDATAQLNLYVNGADDALPPRPERIVPPCFDAAPLTIGGRAAASASMCGNVGHAAIWDGAALSAAEHQLLAEGADPRTIRPANLVFYAPLEDAEAEDLAAGRLAAVLPGAVFSAERWPAAAPLIVSTGDVTRTSVRVMSHVGRAAAHRIEYTTGDFPGVLSNVAVADERSDFVVAHELSGLVPATDYLARLVIDGTVIPASELRFRTAPASAPSAFSFVVASCTRFDFHQPPYWRYDFGAFDGIIARDPDFLVHLGDAWYSDLGGQSETDPFNAWAMNDAHAFTRKARETLGEKHFARVLAAAPVYSMPDDHEWTNNISGVQMFTGDAAERYTHALGRIMHWQFARNPPRLPSAVEDGGLWYSFEYGGVDFFFLDVRTQRSSNAATDTAAKKMLGPDDRQLADLEAWLADSRAAFKVILSPGMISRFGTTGNDAWGAPGGFSTDARAVIERIAGHDHVVFFAGDVHWSGVTRLAPHPSGDSARDLYEFIGAPYAGHLSAPPAQANADLLFTYDGRLAVPQRTSYLHVDVDTAAAPPTMVVRVISHEPLSGAESVEYLHPPIPGRCLADVTDDGAIDVDDLVAVILQWHQASAPADVNLDGTVDIDDLVAVLLGWGRCG